MNGWVLTTLTGKDPLSVITTQPGLLPVGAAGSAHAIEVEAVAAEGFRCLRMSGEGLH
jgi:hypothetical protein